MPNLIHRTLTILKLTDGEWVIESTKPLHHPGTSYKSEARFSLFGLFKEKASVYCPETKATSALKDVVGFMRRDELQLKSRFQRGGVVYHLVLARFDVYFLNSTLFRHKKKQTDWKVTPLADHPFRDDIQKRIAS